MFRSQGRYNLNVKFTQQQATKSEKGTRGIRVVQLFFFNFGARWDAWLTRHTGRLPSGKKPITHCTGGWVGPRAVLDTWGKPRPTPGFDPGPSSS